MAARFRELCADFEVDIPPRILASSLSVAARQLLEIMRAINSEARVVLLDEPTAALSHAERDALLAIIRRLAARGVTIVLVSHNLAEVLDVCDTTSVLRGGRLIETRASSEWTRQELIHVMTGETTEGIMRDERPEYGDVIIEANGVTVPGVIEDIDIVVRAGEVVGLAGLVGSGRTTLLRSLAGAEPRSRGRMRIDGQERKWPHRVRAAVHSLGVALVPEERKTEGLILQQSVPDNVTITRLGDFLMGPFVRTSRQRSRAIALLDQLQLSRPVGSYPVGDLSGGNQQKVAIAKWLHRTPRVLLFDEPTRGIDVAAKAQVLTAIRRYARDGHAVVVTSSELDEVLDVADRLLVMSRGRVVGNIDLHERVPSAREILELSFERTG
jgi:ABC-type sugar transport system ATPase subunit